MDAGLEGTIEVLQRRAKTYGNVVSIHARDLLGAAVEPAFGVKVGSVGTEDVAVVVRHPGVDADDCLFEISMYGLDSCCGL
jgi:hypothetical protein